MVKKTVDSEAVRTDKETAEISTVAERDPVPEVEVAKAPTLEDDKKAAKEVSQGESAEELLAQAVGYLGKDSPEKFVGSPEREDDLKARIEAYFTLKGK